MSDPMAHFRARFVRRCVDDRARIVAAMESWEGGAGDARGELIGIAHGLAGAGGTFGFAGITERAAEFEDRLVAEPQPQPGDVRARLDALLREIDAVIAAHPPGD